MSAKDVTGKSNPNGANSASALRTLPSVDRVISHPAMSEVREQLPQAIITSAARAEVDAAREALLRGETGDLSLEEIAQRASRRAMQMASPSLRPVINAT